MKRALVWAFVTATLLGFAYYLFVKFSPYTRLTSPPPIVGPLPDGGKRIPRPAHVIIVVEENKSLSTIIDNRAAPYINSLARSGALFTNANGVAHPSQPNYLALFSGWTNADGDRCPEHGVDPGTQSLGGALRRAHFAFAGFSENLPSLGFTGCAGGASNYGYVRKHAPWVNFRDVPSSSNVPLGQIPSYGALPTVVFIIPNLAHDMHSGSIAVGDAWLRAHVGPIVSWSATHGALVIIAWDESDRDFENHVPLIFVGAHVKPGRYDERVDHYRVLRTLEDMYGLTPLGYSARVNPITDCWR